MFAAPPQAPPPRHGEATSDPELVDAIHVLWAILEAADGIPDTPEAKQRRERAKRRFADLAEQALGEAIDAPQDRPGGRRRWPPERPPEHERHPLDAIFGSGRRLDPGTGDGAPRDVRRGRAHAGPISRRRAEGCGNAPPSS